MHVTSARAWLWQRQEEGIDGAEVRLDRREGRRNTTATSSLCRPTTTGSTELALMETDLKPFFD